ncbi:MAG TPA: DUF4349 domain-containing protein [Gaiellaceae bacterium]|nr:DUF4349 domain-containing protein [Gaiellaceae bacterium]
MNPSPDLTRELEASRPTAPPALRARVREIAARETVHPGRQWFRLPARRLALVALPAAAALALVSAGAIGLSRADRSVDALREQSALQAESGQRERTPPAQAAEPGAADSATSAIGPTPGRAERVTAVLALEVTDAKAVSRAAQDALDLTRALGGHVVSASVATGEEGSATLTVRVPVTKVQDAIVQLSALGRITSQQVTIDDLQEGLDDLEQRERALRERIARISARLQSVPLDAETRALLETRRQTLRTELQTLRARIASTNAEARMATIQLTVVTPGAQGIVPVPSRLDRTLDEALNVLVWEGVVALAIAIVTAPFALLAIAAWLGQRLYRRREGERLLATR